MRCITIYFVPPFVQSKKQGQPPCVSRTRLRRCKKTATPGKDTHARTQRQTKTMSGFFRPKLPSKFGRGCRSIRVFLKLGKRGIRREERSITRVGLYGRPTSCDKCDQKPHD